VAVILLLRQVSRKRRSDGEKTQAALAAAGGPLPVFAEPVPDPDLNTFSVEHGSDNATYAQGQALLKTQVVGFPKSRAADDALFTLADAYGPGGEAIAE